jgi:hypothetical protein
LYRLVGDETPEAFEEVMDTLRRVATHYKLELLLETVERALRIAPQEEVGE